MNEAETRAELIDPQLRSDGWDDFRVKILREYHITQGRIQSNGKRSRPMIADYVLVYQNQKIAVIEAKSNEKSYAEGVEQAKIYAEKLQIRFTYATNGTEIYEIDMETGKEHLVDQYPSPAQLWDRTYQKVNHWQQKFQDQPFESYGGSFHVRFYQELAVNSVLEAIAADKKRMLLTLATGTGKTFIAFQIVWKLFQTRWNLYDPGTRRPRILFLADRNILADQAFNQFGAFPEDALVRIRPGEIKKHRRVPTNGSIFFSIFQTFMSGPDHAPYFGQYPNDFFDFIIIDECHRGGANDESNWRGILEYFTPAVQLGLTATPKRTHNVDTYDYFGDPVYTYSLKDGINDGFLTPFRVKRIQTTIDDYIYTPDDTIVEGEIEVGREYREEDFNRIIEIKEREKKRVGLFLEQINQKEKALVFCATQEHAAAIRDLINQLNTSENPNYCHRVTANDGKLGEQHLRDFQDNEKSIPTILTTSQKLSTGVDARNIRNIILLRPVNSMIEFKQIVGRGTRLFEGKSYFTLYDFVGAYKHFNDPEWDGDPLPPEEENPQPAPPPGTDVTPIPPDSEPGDDDPPEKRRMVKVKLRDGKEREIQHMCSTSFWSPDGKPIPAKEFLENLFGTLPNLFKDEDELRCIWSDPVTRKALLQNLSEAGFGLDELSTLQELLNAQDSDLFDVLEYVAYTRSPIPRGERVEKAKPFIFTDLNQKQQLFIDYVLLQYVRSGVDELAPEKLPRLLELKYRSVQDAILELGDVHSIRRTFLGFQKYLYIEVKEA